ncbi:transcriptional regulator [Alcanivorax jadensis T9]|jgi:DNA-binding transcriptional MerR regulator|uniref:Transcriptional regulator n=1 Tax=Alcanivorax jadensis T9 TaxID=1177181 RepID=A0ABR4WIJ4_9GAMM|nr:MerR family DNA-binding transcriptional regulator [Alcanivorax jadensis]KGD63034.1 transcriptional regulator [Alcanivorax jadensis T9]MBP21064.1 MerR family transcriptional regulator [Alcanivorax sp.]
MSKKQTYSIGELAREFDVTTRTIRFYEDQGLVAPERRGQTRVYTPADRVTLKLILRGKRLGFSLAESRELIGMYQPQSDNRSQLLALQEKIHQRRVQLDQQLRDIQLLHQELDNAEQRCLESLNQLESKENV